MNDTNGSKMREVETAGEGLSADEDVDGASSNFVIEAGEIIVFGIVAIKTGDFGFREECFELGFE